MIDLNHAAIQPFGRLNKSVLVQLATDAYLELLDITRLHHRECARQQGLDYWCVEGAPVRGKRAAWGKAPLVLAAMALGYESVIWLDADAVIVRPEIDLVTLAPRGVAMVQHPNPEHWETRSHWNSGFFVSRADTATERLWRLVDETPEMTARGWNSPRSMIWPKRQSSRHYFNRSTCNSTAYRTSSRRITL